ncbi:hypothetical protein HDV01_004457 [Terramyces sp. JEL0728]|nr:hypothetical protein HDV01_004457 [Terramyces sp. JEL0728]
MILYILYYQMCWFLFVDFLETLQYIYRHVTLSRQVDNELKSLKRGIAAKGRIRVVSLLFAWLSLLCLCFGQEGFSMTLNCTRLAILVHLKRVLTDTIKKHLSRRMGGMHSQKSYLPQSFASQRSSVKPRSHVRSLRENSGREHSGNSKRETNIQMETSTPKKEVNSARSPSADGKSREGSIQDASASLSKAEAKKEISLLIKQTESENTCATQTQNAD